MKGLDYVKRAAIGLVVGVIAVLLIKPCKLALQKLKQMIPMKSKGEASK